jgi:hypothetical protein
MVSSKEIGPAPHTPHHYGADAFFVTQESERLGVSGTANAKTGFEIYLPPFLFAPEEQALTQDHKSRPRERLGSTKAQGLFLEDGRLHCGFRAVLRTKQAKPALPQLSSDRTNDGYQQLSIQYDGLVQTDQVSKSQGLSQGA